MAPRGLLITARR